MKNEVIIYHSIIEAHEALRQYITDNLSGQFYTCNGLFLYKTSKAIYAVDSCKDGYIISTYIIKK